MTYGRDPLTNTLGDRFMAVLRTAHEKTGLGAVVLIDEYDKPLLDVLDTGLKVTLIQKAMSDCWKTDEREKATDGWKQKKTPEN